MHGSSIKRFSIFAYVGGLWCYYLSGLLWEKIQLYEDLCWDYDLCFKVVFEGLDGIFYAEFDGFLWVLGSNGRCLHFSKVWDLKLLYKYSLQCEKCIQILSEWTINPLKYTK